MIINATLIATISTACLLFLSLHLHKQYTRAKETLIQLSKTLDTISSAIEDDKLTKEEVQQIIKQCKKLIETVEGNNDKRQQR